MASATSNVYVGIGAKLSGSFRSATKSADETLNKLRGSVKKLQTASAQIETFKKQSKATLEAKRSWDAAQKSVSALALEVASAEKPTKKQTQALAKARREASRSKAAFERHRDALRKTKVELKDAGVNTRKLGSEQKRLATETGIATRKEGEYVVSLRKREDAMKASKIETEKNRKAVEENRKAVARAAKERVRNIGKARRDIAKARSRGLKEAQTQLSDAHRSAVDRAASARSRLGGAVTKMAAGAGALGLLVRESAKFETSMLGVAKQIDGARDKNGKLTKTYFDMKDAIEDLADKTPLLRTEVADLAEASARAGIGRGLAPKEQREAIIGFTRDTAKMAAAFDGLEPGELGKKMTTLASNFKIPNSEIMGLADSINFLDSKTRASAAQIIGTTNRISGQAKSLKMAAADTAAVAATFIDAGNEEEVAATAAGELLNRMSTASVRTSKIFNKSLRKMGMTGRQLQKDMSVDPKGTLIKFLEKVNKLSDFDKNSVIYGFAGSGNVKAVSLLASNVDLLKENLGYANAEAAKGSVEAEYQAAISTTAAQTQMAVNQAQRLAATLGDALAPAVRKALADIRPLVESFTKWARENPELVSSIVKITAALAALRLTMLATNAVGLTGKAGLAGGVRKLAKRNAARAVTAKGKTRALEAGANLISAGGIGSQAKSLITRRVGTQVAVRTAATAAAGTAGAAGVAKATASAGRFSGIMTKIGTITATLLPWLAGAFQAVGAVIAGITAPVWGIVAAIVAAVAVIAAVIYKYWKPIKAFFKGLWDGFSQALGRIHLEDFPALNKAFEVVKGVAVAAWEVLSGAFQSVYNWVKELLAPISETDESIAGASETGKSFGETLGSAIEGALLIVNNLLEGLGKVIGMAGEAIDKVKSIGGDASDAVSGAWDSARDFFSWGDDDKPKAPALANRVARAQGGSSTVNQNQVNNINLNVNGGNPREIKRAVVDALGEERRNARARARSSFVGSPAY